MKKFTFKAVHANESSINQSTPPVHAVHAATPIYTHVHDISPDIHGSDYESVQRHRQFMQAVLDQQFVADCTVYFRVPVNTEAYPDYLGKVSHPMDLGTMKIRMDSGVYDSCDISADGLSLVGLDLFFHDLELIIANAKIYNAKHLQPHVHATKMDVQLQGRRKQVRGFLKQVLDSHGVSARSVSSIVVGSGSTAVSSMPPPSNTGIIQPSMQNRTQSGQLGGYTGSSSFVPGAAIPVLSAKPQSAPPGNTGLSLKKKKKAVVMSVEHSVSCRRSFTLFVNRLQHLQLHSYAYRAYIESKNADLGLTNIKYSQGVTLLPAPIKAAVVVSLLKLQEARKHTKVPVIKYRNINTDSSISTNSYNKNSNIKDVIRKPIRVAQSLKKPVSSVNYNIKEEPNLVANRVVKSKEDLITPNTPTATSNAVEAKFTLLLPSYNCLPNPTSVHDTDSDSDDGDRSECMNDEDRTTSKKRKQEMADTERVPSIECTLAPNSSTALSKKTSPIPKSVYAMYGFHEYESLLYRGACRTLTMCSQSHETALSHNCLFLQNPSNSPIPLTLTLSGQSKASQSADLQAFVSALQTSTEEEFLWNQSDSVLFLQAPRKASFVNQSVANASGVTANNVLANQLPFRNTHYIPSHNVIISIVEYSIPYAAPFGIVYQRTPCKQQLDTHNTQSKEMQSPIYPEPTQTSLPFVPLSTRVPCIAVHIFQLPKSNDMYLNNVKLDLAKHGDLLLQPHLTTQQEQVAAKQREKRIKEIQSNRDTRERSLMTVLVPQMEAHTKDMQNKKV